MGSDTPLTGWARRFAVAAVLALGLGACGSDPPPGPPPKTFAEVKVMAAPTLNPDINGRPSPVVVRFYQLGSTEMFGNADFFQIFEQEKATLGPTAIAKQELVVQPGQIIEKVVIPIKADVVALGAVVGYRSFEKATWRAVVPIDLEKTNLVQMQLLSQIVQMTVEKPAAPQATLPRPLGRCLPGTGCLTAALPSADGRS